VQPDWQLSADKMYHDLHMCGLTVCKFSNGG